jgi:hypothetical protein
MNEIRNYKSNEHFDLMPLQIKVDKIFSTTQQWWHFIVNILTLGWFNASRKTEIGYALGGGSIQFSAPTYEVSKNHEAEMQKIFSHYFGD